MEKKITLYVVATMAVVNALPADAAKLTDGVYVVKTTTVVDGESTPVVVEGVPFTSKRQALDAVELTAKFGIETVVVSQKRVVKLV